MFDDHHGELARLLLDQIAVLDGKITQLDARIEQAVTAIPAAWGINADDTTGPEAGTAPDAAVLPAVARLAQIPGVSENLARAVVAETGLDMARFPTAAQLRHEPVPEQGRWLGSVIRGHMAYYAVPGNIRAVRAFRTQLTRHWRAALQSRSQRGYLNWNRMNRLAARWLPPPRILHPYPDERLYVRTEAGAQCVSSARWDLRGGPPARAVPTAIAGPSPPPDQLRRPCQYFHSATGCPLEFGAYAM
jgi:hypothetical protein